MIWIEVAIWRTIRRRPLSRSGRPARHARGSGVGIGVGWLMQSTILPSRDARAEGDLAGRHRHGVRLERRRTWATWCSCGSCMVLASCSRSGPPALLDRAAEHHRGQPADVGPLGRHHVFCVVLAFTHWFLQPPRPAEMGRLFVGTLTLLCSLLLTVMVTILTRSACRRTSRADDLHRRLQARAAARADLGPHDRLHGDRDGAGARLRR